MAPPVAGKAPAKKPRSAVKQPAADRPLRNVVPDSRTQASVLAHIRDQPIPLP